MLEIRVLGGLAVEVDGGPVQLPADARARELLGWLVAAPGLHARSTLAGRLRPGAPACGGAIARVGAEDTAFGDRRAEWMLSIDSSWQDPADDDANVAYTRAFWDATVPFSNGQTYFNFPGLFEEGDAAVRASYGANHARLARIKAAYDPGNVFRPGQNMRPAA